MELKFTGRGAMLNPSEGNTAAYFEDDKNFFLIDCGEDVTNKLIRLGKLNQDKDYYLFITHTHSDHIGSIGTLQQYLYWVRRKKLNIVFGEGMDYKDDINSILTAFGIVPGTYDIVDETSLDNISELFTSIRYRKSNHGDTPLESASIIINTDNGNILYTSDIADSEVIKYFISNNSQESVDKMYIDTSLAKSPVHLSLEELQSIIPDELISKVYCMHLNCKNLIEEANKCGFNVVESNSDNLLTRDIESLDENELQELERILKIKLNQVEDRKQTSRNSKVYLKK